ncbi:MAG: glutamate--tRNA ligase family protein [Bacteroidia bacterium]
MVVVRFAPSPTGPPHIASARLCTITFCPSVLPANLSPPY